MRILVTNDDGIDADGLEALEAVARELSDDVWVVAPQTEQSAKSHSLTMHEPIRIHQYDERRFAVKGTPADCVLLACMEVMPDKRPDLILSGINRGMNVAEDVTYSGTIAAAMEGALLEIPSIALSMAYSQRDQFDWRTPKAHAPEIIRELIKTGWPDGNLVNINFPARPPEGVEGVKVCPQGRRKIGEKLDKRHDPKGRPYFWIGGPCDEPYDDHPGADYMQLQKGYITVTPLQMDLTNYRALEDIREQFEDKAELVLA